MKTENFIYTNTSLNIWFPLEICLFDFLTFAPTTRLYHERVPRLTSDNFKSGWPGKTSIKISYQALKFPTTIILLSN